MNKEPADSTCGRVVGLLTWFVVVFAVCGRGFGLHPRDLSRPMPPVESCPGVNLYWHAPGECWDYGCDQVLNTDLFGSSPNWYVQAEVQPLNRDNLRMFEFASVGEMGPRVLEQGEFNDQFDSGMRLLAGVSLSEWYRLEAAYWGPYKWNNDSVIRNIDANAQGGTGNLFSPLSNFGDPAVLGLDYNTLATIGMSSRMHIVELNLRRRIATHPSPFEASCLVGLKYMRLEEQFNYHTESGVPLPQGAINDAQSATDNDMIGAQIGILGQWVVHQRSWIDWDVKGAVLSNSVDLQSNYRNTDENGVVTTATGADDATKTAFTLETSVMLNHQFTQTLTFRVGYRAMWLTGVALGADNLSLNSDALILGPVSLDTKGRMAFHGPTIGLVGAW